MSRDASINEFKAFFTSGLKVLLEINPHRVFNIHTNAASVILNNSSVYNHSKFFKVTPHYRMNYVTLELSFSEEETCIDYFHRGMIVWRDDYNEIYWSGWQEDYTFSNSGRYSDIEKIKSSPVDFLSYLFRLSWKDRIYLKNRFESEHTWSMGNNYDILMECEPERVGNIVKADVVCNILSFVEKGVSCPQKESSSLDDYLEYLNLNDYVLRSMNPMAFEEQDYFKVPFSLDCKTQETKNEY